MHFVYIDIDRTWGLMGFLKEGSVAKLLHEYLFTFYCPIYHVTHDPFIPLRAICSFRKPSTC